MKKQTLLFYSIVTIILGFMFYYGSSATEAREQRQGSRVGQLEQIQYQVKEVDFSCGTPITDRDGYVYPTVQIGGQCWLGKNLKTKRKPDLTSLTNLSDGSERDCSNTLGVHGTEADCDAGHALYTWNAAMNGSSTEGAQGLCMDGWHIPTDADWHTLENFLKNPGQTCNASRVNTFDCDNAGEKLRVGGSVNFSTSSPGLRYSDFLFGDSFNDFDFAMYFWSSSKTGNNVQAYSLNTAETRIWRGPIDVNPLNPVMSLSVRCLKNY